MSLFNNAMNIGIGIGLPSFSGAIKTPPIPWTPENDAYVWYDLNDTSTVTYDAETMQISSILDKGSSGGALVQSDTAKQGVYVDSNAIKCYDTQTYSSDLDKDVTGSFMYIDIVKTNDITQAFNIWANSETIQRDSSGRNRQAVTDTASNSSTAKEVDVYRSECLMLDNGTTNSHFKQNATFDGDVVGSNISIINPLKFFNSSVLLDLYLREFVLYDKYDETLMETTEGYIHWNNGLESLLPEDHKYKNGRPVIVYLTDANGNILTDTNGVKLYTIEPEA